MEFFVRKQDIVKGGIYWDGNMGVRKILGVGPEYRKYLHRADRDCVQFQILSDSRHGVRTSRFEEASIRESARQSFASWAKSRVETEEELYHLMETIHAKVIRLPRPVANELLKLAPALSSRRQSSGDIDLSRVPDKIRRQMEGMELLDALRGPKGEDDTFVLTSLGRKVIEQLVIASQAAEDTEPLEGSPSNSEPAETGLCKRPPNSQTAKPM